MEFIWTQDTLSTVYLSNDQVTWTREVILLGRNYSSGYNYAMFSPNSVVYLYQNTTDLPNTYVNKFVGQYYSGTNASPISISGIQTLDFHLNNDYYAYCSCISNNNKCRDQGFSVSINESICNNVVPTSLPPPTQYEPPSTAWIWISIAVLAFLCLLLFLFIILFYTGAFKFDTNEPISISKES